MGKKGVENSLRLLVKTSFIVLIGIFLSKILSYLYRIIIARQFGPEEYGLLSLAIVIIGFFVAFSSIGVGDGIGRFVPIYRAKNKKEEIKYLFKYTFSIISVLSILLGVLLFIFAETISVEIFKNSLLTNYLRFFSILVPVSALVNNLLETLRAYEKISSFSFIFNILQNVVKIIALGLFTYFAIFSNSNKVIFSYSLAILSMLIAGYYAIRKNIPELFDNFRLNERKKKDIRKEVLNYSIPLLFSGIITSLFYWVDSLSLGYLRNVTSVGFYNAAVPIAMLLLLIPEIFMQLFKPLINKEYGRNNKVLIREISKQVTKWIFIIALPVFMLLFIFPGAAINILFGESYLVAENALRLLSLGALISAISVVPGHLLLMKGKSNLTFINILLATILNVILNFIFIPLPSIVGIDNASGLNGAAFATLISATFLSIIQFWQAKKYIGVVPLRRKMLTIFLVSLISLYLLIYVKSLLILSIFNVAILCMGFLILYFVLVLLTKGFDRNDYMIIKSIRDKVIAIKR